MLAALNSAAMTVVFFLTGAGHALVKVGLFDFAAAGALVVTNRFPEVEPYLDVRHARSSGFDSTDDLLRAVRRLLRPPGAKPRPSAAPGASACCATIPGAASGRASCGWLAA